MKIIIRKYYGTWAWTILNVDLTRPIYLFNYSSSSNAQRGAARWLANTANEVRDLAWDAFRDGQMPFGKGQKLHWRDVLDGLKESGSITVEK